MSVDFNHMRIVSRYERGGGITSAGVRAVIDRGRRSTMGVVTVYPRPNHSAAWRCKCGTSGTATSDLAVHALAGFARRHHRCFDPKGKTDQ